MVGGITMYLARRAPLVLLMDGTCGVALGLRVTGPAAAEKSTTRVGHGRAWRNLVTRNIMDSQVLTSIAMMIVDSRRNGLDLKISKEIAALRCCTLTTVDGTRTKEGGSDIEVL